MADQERSRAASVAVVLGVTVAASVALTLLGVGSAVLFGSLLGGMAHALTSPTPLDLPRWSFRLGQGLIGVTIGTLVSGAALRRMGEDAVAVVGVTVASVLISLAAGAVLARRRDVSAVTGAFAMIAGGASGVVAVARDLGADERVVTVVQYLRVLVVLASLPLVTALVFHPDSGRGSAGTADAPLWADLVCTGVALVVGLGVAGLVPLPTGSLLGPLLVAAVIASAGWLGEVSLPTPLEWLAFAIIGVQVGLRFTRASLAAIARMLPVVMTVLVVMIGLTATLGAGLAWTTSVDGLTAYLATTPGGLFAVVAIAADSGADVTYVTAMQLFRLLLILAMLPLLARWLRRSAPS
ncbi:AbrB family transcriptional regulator [Nocardioides marinquilinus]|uniref:AbrB family transcriptional regulator n=1 Tax=Nocardioides marinquilinus TaxID=1210400 RepID=A0ABP9Q521_9ACTN